LGEAIWGIPDKIALERKDAAETEETRLTSLRSRYPELADKVVEGGG